MVITLRLPRSSALKLNLAVGDIDRHEVVTTLTAVELAGRLSLATGKAIGPDAVVEYCFAWRAASEALRRLIAEHGRTALARMLRKACSDCALWTPRGNAATLKWLRYVLEFHFLSQRGWGPPPPECRAAAREKQTDMDLVALCEASFPQAYGLWLIGEGSRPVSDPVVLDDERQALPTEERPSA